jgi:diguanylate cyclase (GGDEF)-like protein
MNVSGMGQARGIPRRQEPMSWLARGLDAAGDVAYACRLATGALQWSAAADGAFRLATGDELARRDVLRRRVHPDDLAAFDECLVRHASTGERFEVEYRVRAGDGSYIWVQDRGAVVYDESGRAAEVHGVLRVVTPYKQREARLERLANFDELTGHYNLRRLRDQLELALASARRHGAPGAYLSVIIEDLTLLADVYGGDVANAALIGVGQKLDRCLRESDVTGRTGADSFGVILDGCPPDRVDAAVGKISAMIDGLAAETPVGRMRFKVSIGAVAFPGAEHAAQDVMHKAEHIARGDAKAAEPRHDRGSAKALAHKDLAIIDRLRWCLENDGLDLAFQPIVERRSGRVAFQECLLRPAQASGLAGQAGPLVRAAERVGLIRQVDRRILELVLAELEQDSALVAAVNVSGLTTSDPQWLRRLVAAARARSDLPTRLLVEITETAALQDLEESARFVASLRDMGCRVALDDFGAGHTSFRTLKALAVDMIKIDGSFVTGLARQPSDLAFVRALASLAESSGKATVAECIEDDKTAAMLEQCGVDYLQGYLYGRPVVRARDRRVEALGLV